MWKRDMWDVQYWNPGTRPRSDITDYDFDNVAELIKIKYPQMATLHRTAPLPASSKPGGRVRVQAGDKGVSPIKSKPKRRKNLTAQEQTGLSMAAVEWSEKTYHVEDLVQYHGGRFPVIVKVTNGYRGELDVDYDVGTVVQLQGHGIQERLVAMDSQGRRLSVPLEYPVNVEVQGTDTKETKTLEAAVRKYNLPLMVNVVSAEEHMRIGQANIIGETINIIDTHEDTYVKGNAIVDGWIDQSDIAIIPSFLRVKFSVAVGMRGASDDEWDDYRNMFARSVRHLFKQFGRISGWPGVIIQDRGGSAGSRPNSPGAGRRGGENVYQNSPRVIRREEMYQNLPPKSPRPIRRVPQLAPPSSPRLVSSMSLPLRESSSSNDADTSVHMIQVDVHTESLPRSQTDPDGGHLHNMAAQETIQAPVLHRGRSRRDTTTDGESADELDVDRMFERVLVVAEEEERRSLERDNARHDQQERERKEEKKEKEKVRGSITTNSNTVMNLVNRLNANTASVDTRTDINQNRPSNSQAPRAVVPPTRQFNNNKSESPMVGPFVVSVNVGTLRPGDNNNIEVSKSGISHMASFRTLEEVPRDIGTLTVEDVCRCLHLLNMDGHVAQFRNQQVDGKLMNDMREAVLQSEFNFTPFNASKLMRFARGWRPRFT